MVKEFMRKKVQFIKEEDTDFLQSGLKTSSIIRIGRLAVVNKNVLLGSIGNIGLERLASIKKKLSEWIRGT